MEEKIRQYFALKMRQKELEQELAGLRKDIIGWLTENGWTEWSDREFRARLVIQERKEFDDIRLYEALPDKDIWRLVSRADPARITGLLKVNVISEDWLKGTYTTKTVSLLQVEKL